MGVFLDLVNWIQLVNNFPQKIHIFSLMKGRNQPFVKKFFVTTEILPP